MELGRLDQKLGFAPDRLSDLSKSLDQLSLRLLPCELGMIVTGLNRF